MKSTPQIDSPNRDQRTFPLTDYQFQTSAELADRSTAVPEKTANELQTFRKLSNEFFATETQRDYIAELLLFVLISGIAAWPIISSMVAITRLVRNY